MEKIVLRDYQKNQIDFIEKKQFGKLPIAIQSPTGSGKSYTILEYVRRRFELNQDSDETIVISTGFNNLVYQIAEDAKKFGLKPLLWLGKMHTNCGIKIMKQKGVSTFPSLKDYPGFTKDKNKHPDNSNCWKTCEYSKKCLYFQSLNAMKSFGPKLIITNHSSYLLGLKLNFFKPDVAIIDESHTFASFYESFLKMEINKKEIETVLKTLDVKKPTSMLFRKVLENNIKISPQLCNQLKKELGDKNYRLANKLEELSRSEISIDKYIDISKNGIEIIKFWSKFEIDQSKIFYILFSATQDVFTREMFGVPKQRFYIENKCNTINYEDSEFIIVPEEEFSIGIDKFLKYMKEKEKSKGLILSTTMEDVNYLLDLKTINGYKVFTSIDKFNETKSNAILVGSRSLFQGIDIDNLEFVCLNKIPFPTYDKKFQAQANYLEKVARMDAWNEFTIPKVKNDITQTTGRLWRHPGDKGTIAIMDPRLLDKFKYFISYVEEVRKGIKFFILGEESHES